MKFACDKCKTRYSIGEDRVRGKILKIRCKNCANVITVREGMDAGENRSGKATMAVPLLDPSVLAAPAPSALNEEWYVSIDGVQTGPLTLPNAQKWVSSKPVDAELHCWNEGFEDWLPVEKVSHFRGLRKSPAAPPPRPRPKTAPPPTPEKPLFAATMASIEKDASGPIKSTGSGPQRTSAPAIPAAAQAKSNGTGPRPAIPAAAKAPAIPAAASKPGIPSIPAVTKPSGPTSSAIPSIPAAARPSGPSTSKSPTPARGSASVVARGATPAAAASNRFLASAVPSAVSPASAATAKSGAAASALADAFDSDDNDALTAVGSVPFEDEVATRSEPAAAASSRARNMFDVGTAAPVSAPAPAPTKTVKQALESDDEDDDLAIGEVSRVVNLADLAPRPNRANRPTANGTGANAKIGSSTGGVAKVGSSTGNAARISSPVFGHTGSQPRISPSALGMNVDPSLAATADLPGGPAANESIVARSFAEKHRRGLVALIAVSALLVAGVVGVVAWVVSKNSDEIVGGLGGMKQIDTSRPEDIIRRQQQNPTDTGSGSAGSHVTQNKPRYTGRNSNNTLTQPDDDPTGNSLSASEIEDMAAKQNEGTKRCYMRAQKGALGFEIADLKKITVTLAVNKDGTVTDVQLSSHATDTLGTCLIARIKAWKFRTSSSGGTFRISLAFSS